MVQFSGLELFAAVVTIMFVVVILLLIMVYKRRQAGLTNDSFPTSLPCKIAPVTPLNLRVSNPQGDLVILEWDPVASTEDYLSQISFTSNMTDGDIIQEKITTSPSSAFANIPLGATYYFRVKARSPCGESEFSAEISYRLEFKFPGTFNILLDIDPTYRVCDGHNSVFNPTNNIGLSQYCDQTTSTFFFEESDKSLRQSSRPSMCITRLSPSSMAMVTCSGGANQKWTYSGVDNTLCSGLDENQGCLWLDGVYYGPRDDDPRHKWSIV